MFQKEAIMDKEDISSRLFDLEDLIKSTGLKLADDWALFFRRCSKGTDEIFSDIQLGMVLLLYMTWQEAHGFTIGSTSIAEELAPHDVKEEEILRILKKMEKIGLVDEEATGKSRGHYYLNCSEFTKRVGWALGFEAEVEERIKEVKKQEPQ